MAKREKIEIGNKVKYAKTRDGYEPHANWVGEIVEIKSAEGEKYFRAMIWFYQKIILYIMLQKDFGIKMLPYRLLIAIQL